MIRGIGFLTALAFALPCFGAVIGGVSLPDNVTVGGKELVLNGGGVRTKAIFKVYVGSLYVAQKTASLSGVLASMPRRIQLNVLRDLTADQLVDALVEGLKDNNSAAELAAIKASADQLVAIMKSFQQVKENDVVTLDLIGDETQVSLNGRARGSIAGARFNAALVRIWLGDNPAQSDLKKAMLGG